MAAVDHVLPFTCVYVRPAVHTFVQHAQHIYNLSIFFADDEHLTLVTKSTTWNVDTKNLLCKSSTRLYFLEFSACKGVCVCVCDSIYLFIYANCANSDAKDYARKKKHFLTP